MIKRLFTLGSVLVLLTGCQSASEVLRSLNPQANDYASALASEYLAYSESETEQGRKEVGEYFAVKGLKASRGEPVELEKPAATLSKARQKELNTARTLLAKLQNDNMKSVSPQKVARAQLLFDCWAHQQNMKISAQNAPCKEEFQATMKELTEVGESFRHAQENNYVLTFEKGSSEISAEGYAMLEEATSKALAAADYNIELRGMVGKAKGSQALLNKRFETIKQTLVEKKIIASRIHLTRDNNSKVVILSDDVVQDENQVDMMVETFSTNKEQ